jgi:hypothetical protein
MQDVVKPWMDRVANGCHYVFQQDGATAYNVKVTQEWCEANLPEFWSKGIWPPSSPDCNPLDYSFGAFAREMSTGAPTTLLPP